MEANMKNLRVPLLALVLIMGVVGVVSANGQAFTTTLSGAEEVPPRDTIAGGNAVFVLSQDGTELKYRLVVNNIENVTQAHIHIGPPGVNGGVVLFLYPSAPPAQLIPGLSNGLLGHNTATAADLRGPLQGQPLSALIEALETGNAYVNVHTSQFPGGEIRGQVD
jgi:hypothetical protein